MQLLQKPKVVGTNLHRCGWPYVINHMKHIDTNDGILCDDFLEQTFDTTNKIPESIQQQPWIAIAHLPPTKVRQFMPTCFLDYNKDVPGSAEAIKNLKGICTMSHHLADRFRQVCDVLVNVIHYPTNTNVKQFDINSYMRQPTLVHVGWFFKNLLLLEHIPPNNHIQRKIQILAACLKEKGAVGLRNYLHTHMYPNRTLHGGVTYLYDRVPDATYDNLLTQSVMAIEFVDCAATTVVVESLARCAPMLLNRHPALLEYVGKDYPMFFDDIRECEQLLHPANVYKTHEYIRHMDKSFLSIENFLHKFQLWVAKYE